ncbi:MAG: DUF4129 domain-containing protein [Tepidiformaceae bacterium]
MIAVLAVLAAVAAEGLALYTLAEWIGAGYQRGHHPVSGVSFVAVALGAFALPRAVPWFVTGTRSGYALIVGLAGLLLYSVLRLEFAGDLALWDLSWISVVVSDAEAGPQRGGEITVGAILLFALVVRSIIRSGGDVDMEVIPRQVGLPFAAVTLVLILGAATDRTGEIARAGAAFYALAILALAFSQLALSGATIGSIRAGGVTAILLGGTIAATAACVLVFGLLFGILGPIIGPALGAVVETVLTILLTPPAWLIDRLFSLLFANATPFPEINAEQFTQGRLEEARDGPESGASPWSQFAAMAFRVFGLLLLLALAAGMIAMVTALRRRAKPPAAASPSTSTAGSLAADARELMRSLFRRPRRMLPGSTDSAAVRLYREVLAKAEQRGHPRPLAETAGEFAPTLAVTFDSSVTDEITAAFQEARYAAREPGESAFADLERRWRTLP